MKIAKTFHTFGIMLSLLVVLDRAAGQASDNSKPELIPFIGPNHFSNVIVHVDSGHPLFCPLELTNHISNTNLFTLREQEKLAGLREKYQNVSTNSPPKGAVFQDWQTRCYVLSFSIEKNGKVEREVKTNRFIVARFVYTNTVATEEMLSIAGRQIISRFRDNANNGYDVAFADNDMGRYIEYKDGRIDGLYVTFGDNPDQGRRRVVKTVGTIKPDEIVFRWARFSKGQMVGRLLDWDKKGQLTTHVEFKEPFDFLAYSKSKFDLSWEVVP